MKEDKLCDEFQRNWDAFLAKRDHKLSTPKGVSCVRLSQNAGGTRYRWLLLVARGKSRTLNRFELEDVKHHLRRAHELNQKAYVVIKFREPEQKVIILPAEKVVRKRLVRSHKGGIPWCK